MKKFKYGDKVIGTTKYRKQFGKQISGSIERNVIVDELGAVVQLKLQDGSFMNIDQNWLMLDPCLTCDLAKDGVCKEVEP